MSGDNPSGRGNFSEWLTAMAKAMGYGTDAALSDALGISQSTILRWRQGSKPSIRHLASLSRVLGTRLEALLVLTGHVSADAFGANTDTPEPPSATTEAVRKIKDATLGEPLKERLLKYWELRLGEERGRLYALIKALEEEELKGPEGSLDVAEAYRLMKSDLPKHFADLMTAARRYFDLASPRRGVRRRARRQPSVDFIAVQRQMIDGIEVSELRKSPEGRWYWRRPNGEPTFEVTFTTEEAAIETHQMTLNLARDLLEKAVDHRNRQGSPQGVGESDSSRRADDVDRRG
ncbi:helix-turn-helix transcriptional regulator [Nonomuraea longicatena]|uniref:HTH cro/C1-type domain-containing protein n=1 Tax=Nonomuraea longicatena TaxID=83682 RepID=A0ABN1QUJ5_9ACTN